MHKLSCRLPSPLLMEGGHGSNWLIFGTSMSIAIDLLMRIHSHPSSVLQGEQGDTVKGDAAFKFHSTRSNLQLCSILFCPFLFGRIHRQGNFGCSGEVHLETMAARLRRGCCATLHLAQSHTHSSCHGPKPREP